MEKSTITEIEMEKIIATMFYQPLTFDEFEALYQKHLGAPDQPTCYMAYIRAESEHTAGTGDRRYKNYATFVATRTRNNRNIRATPENNTSAKVTVKCQLCDGELYRVPRGDLRTIIPHFCEGCREEIKKLIFI